MPWIKLPKTKTYKVNHITYGQMLERFKNIRSYLSDANGIIEVTVEID